MHIHFEPITSQNREIALNLKIADSQHGFIESVQQCLSEADRCKRWHPVGIYDGDTMVGFAMYGFFRWQYLPFGKLWMDRLLIDEKYQGKGYGGAALSGLLHLLTRDYRCRKIYLSVIEGNDAAVRLYEKFGFSFNGKRDMHGEHIMVYQVKPQF